VLNPHFVEDELNIWHLPLSLVTCHVSLFTHRMDTTKYKANHSWLACLLP
jgi:hypothetical protein